MGAYLVIVLAAVALQDSTHHSDTFATPATRRVVERAMVRHRLRDSAVADYEARIRYRLTVGSGRRRWARIPAAAVEEQDARVQWQRPNDLRVEVLGRRFRARAPGIQLSSVFDRPWFVPRSVDDSLRIFSDEFPATGALHPLAEGALAWYRYALTDSLAITTPQGKRLRLVAVEVTPRRIGPALIAGRVWIDARSGEVVRLTFRYVGTGLWVRPEEETRRDSTSARRLNSIVNRVLSLDADLEYAVQEGRFWMPYRQTVSGTVRIPVVSDLVIPFQARTTFSDYAINNGRAITFDVDLPDSGGAAEPPARRRDRERRERRLASDSLRDQQFAGRWEGGRYELHRPSNDSLGRYRGWEDSLTLSNMPGDEDRARAATAELARLSQQLPDELTGQRAHGIGYERLADALQYNRVQGLSLGLGYRLRLSGLAFTNLYGTIRYGFSDERVMARLAAVRDAPGGRLRVSAYRELADIDPFSPGRTLGNAVNALFFAHDYGDYYLAQGGSASFEASLRTGLELALAGRLEHQGSVGREAHSAFNDVLGGSGRFPDNPPIDAGVFGGLAARLSGFGARRWSLTADALSGEGTTTGRVYGEARESFGGERGLSVRLKAGIASAPTLPQMAFRVGGLNTVRGFTYGVSQGQAFWAAQVDITPLARSIRPVLFIDAGRAARAADLFDGRVLVGGGVGLSLFSPLLRSSLIRLDLSHPISPSDGKLRLDLLFQAIR